jgi:hemoglobin-like flavoprotein
MTPQQIALVKSTWAQVVPIREQAAALFYGKLFEADPAVRSLFRSDMKGQGAKLMAMIDVAVGGLDRIESLLPAVQDLGRRHAGYGVEARHYETVGGALLATLEAGLGPAFTPEAKAAWAATYGALAGVMKAAAAQPA